MNTNWSKILLFSLLSFALGFVMSRTCCRERCHGGECGERGGCHKEMSCCKDGQCEHGGTCCKEGGKCDKAGCDHAAMMGGHGKACCMGGHGEMGGCMGGHGEGHGGCGMHGDGDDKVHAVIDGLKSRNFQGDTTINIDGGTVNVKRTGDKMEVRVEMRDSVKIEGQEEASKH